LANSNQMRNFVFALFAASVSAIASNAGQFNVYDDHPPSHANDECITRQGEVFNVNLGQDFIMRWIETSHNDIANGGPNFGGITQGQ